MAIKFRFFLFFRLDAYLININWQMILVKIGLITLLIYWGSPSFWIEKDRKTTVILFAILPYKSNFLNFSDRGRMTTANKIKFYIEYNTIFLKKELWN